MKIYLAGGMRDKNGLTAWQSIIMNRYPCHTFYNPQNNYINNNNTLFKYGAWDLHHIKMCDMVVAYMSKDNPSGFGMCTEIGYAKGLGKTVIFCRELGNEHNKDEHIQFADLCSDIVFHKFEEMVDYLRSYSND